MKNLKKCFNNGLVTISLVGAIGVILSVTLNADEGIIKMIPLFYLLAVMGHITYKIYKIKHFI